MTNSPSKGDSHGKRDKHTEWVFWIIFFSGMAIFLGVIVLVLRIEYEKVVNLRSYELFAPKERICSCAGSTIVDDGHGRGDMKQLAMEADRWRAVAEEYRDLLVRSGVLRITGKQAEGGQEASEQILTTVDHKLVGEL